MGAAASRGGRLGAAKLRVMKREASTRSHECSFENAAPAAIRRTFAVGRPAPGGAGMMRLVLVVFVLLLVVLGVGMAVLGAFPPGPRTEQVQRVLPNDKFAPR